MSIGIFTDKKCPPTIAQVFEAIGPKRSAWEKLTWFIQEEFGAREEFRFYGRNYGWALRFRKSGKALASLYPAEKSFVVQVVLGAANVKQARGLHIGKHIQQIIDQANAYPEGRWLFIPIKSEKDVREAQQLLTLKSAKRQRANEEKRWNDSGTSVRNGRKKRTVGSKKS